MKKAFPPFPPFAPAPPFPPLPPFPNHRNCPRYRLLLPGYPTRITVAAVANQDPSIPAIRVGRVVGAVADQRRPERHLRGRIGRSPHGLQRRGVRRLRGGIRAPRSIHGLRKLGMNPRRPSAQRLKLLASGKQRIAADTSSLAAATTAVVGAAAAECAALIDEPMPATSAAAAANVSGSAITYDTGALPPREQTNLQKGRPLHTRISMIPRNPRY